MFTARTNNVLSLEKKKTVVFYSTGCLSLPDQLFDSFFHMYQGSGDCLTNQEFLNHL